MATVGRQHLYVFRKVLHIHANKTFTQPQHYWMTSSRTKLLFSHRMEAFNMWRSLATHVLLFRSEGPPSLPPGGDPLKSKLHDLEKFHLLEEETYTKQTRTKRRPTRIEKEKRWYKNRIQKLSKRGEVEEALGLFKDMLSKVLYPETVVFNNLISGLGRKGEIKKAFKLFNDLKKRGLLPSEHTYTSLFNCCSVAGRRSLPYLKLVRDEMERRSVIPNTVTSNAIIKAYTLCGEHKKAFEVYMKMSNWSCSPDLRTYGFLLMACCEDKVGGVKTCLQVWAEIVAGGLRPDVYSFNLALRCVRDGGIPKDMLHPLETKDVQMSTIPSNSELLHCAHLTFDPETTLKLVVESNHRRWFSEEDIVLLLELMEKNNAAPNIKTFNILLGLLFKAPSSEEHFLWDLMKKYKIEVDIIFMNSLVECHSMRGDISKVKDVLSLMKKWGIPATIETYQACAAGCAKEKDGVWLLDIMKVDGSLPNEQIFESLLKAAVKCRQYSHVIALLKHMKDLAILPNNSIKSILTTAAEPKDKQKLSGYLLKQFNGFKGYLTLWKSSMWISDEGEDPETEQTD